MRDALRPGALLDYLFDEPCFECGSDLKESRSKTALLQIFDNMDLRLYNLDQWNYALSYIAEREVEVGTWEELEEFLKQKHSTNQW